MRSFTRPCSTCTAGPIRSSKVCGEGDRFAAAVLMQPAVFLVMARASGLDVLALQRMYRCSYASVAIRLAEVVRYPPFMVVLYENGERGDPAGWKEPASLRATVVRRTRGMNIPSWSLVRGARGNVPRRGMPPTPPSLAYRSIRSGVAEFAEDGRHALIARPVHWKDRLAKVAVVAVPARHASLLEHQFMASRASGRKRQRSHARHW